MGDLLLVFFIFFTIIVTGGGLLYNIDNDFEPVRWWVNEIIEGLGFIKRAIWNRGLRLWWCRLWIRHDEFHWTLNADHEALQDMDKEQQEAYWKDLGERRRQAHLKDLEK